MIAVTIVNILAVLIAYAERSLKLKNGLLVSTLLLIIFYGIRYDYGNDYLAYVDIFNDINRYVNLDYSTDETNKIEVGWRILNRAFSDLGFETLVFLLTTILFGTFYWVTNKYIKREYQYFTLFVFLFSPGLMLTLLSSMRQTLAICIIIWAIPYILNKKWYYSIPIIVLAAQFHTSAYMMLLLPLTVFLLNTNRKIYIASFAFAMIFIMFAQEYVAFALEFILINYFPNYYYYMGNSGDAATLGIGIGYVFNIIMFAYLIVYDKQKKDTESWFMKMSAISYILLPISFILMTIGRITLYFRMFTPFAFTTLLDNKNKKIPYFIFILNIFFLLYGYFTFFYNPTFTEKYMTYKTIF